MGSRVLNIYRLDPDGVHIDYNLCVGTLITDTTPTPLPLLPLTHSLYYLRPQISPFSVISAESVGKLYRSRTIGVTYDGEISCGA